MLKLEEVLLQQWQASLVEALHGWMYSALHQSHQGPEGVLLIHVQQQQTCYEPHPLYIANLHMIVMKKENRSKLASLGQPALLLP